MGGVAHYDPVKNLDFEFELLTAYFPPPNKREVVTGVRVTLKLPCSLEAAS